ncbi:MAG: DNA-3-methyladenine glycosylase family protein [Pyrinomonadaceae bacterium]
MSGSFVIETPSDFSFRHTVQSHGWYDLSPFILDENKITLSYVFSLPRAERPFLTVISETASGVSIEYSAARVDKNELAAAVRHILRLDEDLTGFYDLIEKGTVLDWVTSAKAGRLLRSPTVFEDLVKTICTTNCSWALTKKMVSNLVEKLGEPASKGRRSFPTALAMAKMSDEFYREEIKAGYRSPYFVELAQAVAAGELDPESWLCSDLSTAELKKEMKKVKGVGDYAAENLLKLIGRYDGLALDSFLRGEFYKKHNRQKACPDKKIEKHYKKFGDWRGLAIWCDMTERWFA